MIQCKLKRGKDGEISVKRITLHLMKCVSVGSPINKNGGIR